RSRKDQHKIKSSLLSRLTSHPAPYVTVLGVALLTILIFSESSIYKSPKSEPSSKTIRIKDSIVVNHHLRYYILHIPQRYDSTSPLPLVFVLHGAFEEPQKM